MLISGWRRFYDEGDGGSADAAPASAGSEGGGDLESAVSDSGSDSVSTPAEAGDSGLPEGGQAAVAGAATPQPSFLDVMRDRYGVDVSSKYKSEEEFARGFVHSQQLIGRLGQEAALARRYAGHEQAFEEYLAYRNQQAAQQQQQEEAKPWWNPPQQDPSWQRWVTRDAEGNATLREDTPLEVRRAIEEFQTYRQNWEHKLLNNPQEALKGAFEEHKESIRREIMAEIQQQQSHQQVSAQSMQFVSQNANWLYERTQDGQVVRNFENGQPMLSLPGAFFFQHLQRLAQNGIKDTVEAQQIAMALTRQSLAEHQAAQNGTAGAGQASAPPARTAPAAPVHPGLTRGRQPTGGNVPGQPKNNAGSRGRSVKELLAHAAKDIPENEFSSDE